MFRSHPAVLASRNGVSSAVPLSRQPGEICSQKTLFPAQKSQPHPGKQKSSPPGAGDGAGGAGNSQNHFKAWNQTQTMKDLH